MKKIINKISKIVMILSILVFNFVPIIRVNAIESEITAHVKLTVNGDDLEYNTTANNDGYIEPGIFFTINNSNQFKFKSNEVTYSGTAENRTGFETTSLEYKYYAEENDDEVTFTIYTAWDDIITSLKINGTSYTTPQTKQELASNFKKDGRRISFNIDNVPKNQYDTYEVVIEARKQNESELYMGNFLWSYYNEELDVGVSDDEKIPHGKLELVKASYGGVDYDIDSINDAGNIYQWEDGIKQSDYTSQEILDRIGIGEAMFPTDTEITVKLIPDAGYQLTNLWLNNQPFEAGNDEEVGLYTFTITGGNFHLGAEFTEVENIVNTDETENVESGSIDIDFSKETTSFKNGTAKLEISDVDPDTKEDFEEQLPEEYEIDTYLDISLYNSIYKGTDDSNSSWDSEVTELNDTATITLDLTNDMSGKEIEIIHELHDENNNPTGEYDIIDDVTYDEENNSITFQTDGFSNYALISKESEKEDYSVSDTKGNIIEFNKGIGHTYIFDMVSYIGITDEELEAFQMTKEEYNTKFTGIQNATKKYGNILGIYEIILVDEETDEDIHDGPFKIKIKMTDEMKKYDEFSLIYTDVDNNYETEEPIKLTIENDYLVGQLEHLSVYSLVGNKSNKVNVENPKTSDNILTTIFISGASLILIILSGTYIRKKIK